MNHERPTDPLTLDFDINRGELLALIDESRSQSATLLQLRGRLRYRLPILLALLWCVFFLLFGFSWGRTIVFGVVALLWFFFYPIKFDRDVKKNTEKMLSEERYRKVFGAYRLVLSPQGLHSVGPFGEGRYDWSAIQRVRLADDHLFILLWGDAGYCIAVTQVGAQVAQEAYRYLCAYVPAVVTESQG